MKKLEAQLASIGENPATFTASFSSETSVNAPMSVSRNLGPSHLGTTSTSDDALDKTSCSDRPGRDSTEVSTRENSHDQENLSLPPLPQNRDDTQIVIKSEPSSDIPIVVSERSGRKRRRENDEADHTPMLTRVKLEDTCNPIPFQERGLMPQDSMDFDADVPHIQTPRKHRLRLSQGDSVSYTPDIPPTQHNTSRPVSRNTEHGTSAEAEDGTSGQRGIQPTETHTRPASAVEPLNAGGVRNQTRCGSDTRPTGSTSIRRGLASLAEDDDQYRSSKVTSSTSRVPRRNNVLSDLLNTPSAERGTGVRAVTSRSEPPPISEPSSATSGFRLELPPERDLPFGKNKQRTKSSAPPASKSVAAVGQASHKNNGGKTINPPTGTYMHGKSDANNNDSSGGALGFEDALPAPLRGRPLSQLRLSDFKVNPATNDGYSYAFNDVVRGGAERATALVGCIRDDCCGRQFRALARAERHSTGAFAFRALLEEYLGDDAWRLGSMPTQEKEELWLEAKTRALANQHGRCRHRYQRMPSPPGFWRTDFPSTQETAEHTAQGRKMEAEMIQERYHEAMRSGGRWLFRDE